MTTLILIRHGQSRANVEGVFAGHKDFPLTEIGIQQAERTAEYVAANFKVDAIYASDLKRAFYTGKILADKLGLCVYPEKELREIYAGEWEGNSFDYLQETFFASYGTWLADIGNAKPENGETVEQLMHRVYSAVQRIAEQQDGRNVVIATHATPIRALQCICEGKTKHEMKNVPWVSNSSVTVLTYQNGVFHIKTIGYDRHLGNIKSSFPNNV